MSGDGLSPPLRNDDPGRRSILMGLPNPSGWNFRREALSNMIAPFLVRKWSRAVQFRTTRRKQHNSAPPASFRMATATRMSAMATRFA